MLDNYQDLIDELLGAPSLIRNAITAHGGDAPPEVLGLIVMLTERDAIVLERLNRMRREANPHLRALTPLEDTEPRDANLPLDEALKTFDANRGELVSLLMNLTLKDWERVATHEIEGEVTIADEVELHVESDEAIRARIEATLG
jgi:MoxR-like ATPase